MKVHAVWNPSRTAKGAEWVFLIVGLTALDVYVWVNTSTILYQAYQDWAFDQRLRELPVTISQFARDEVRAIVGKEYYKPELGTVRHLRPSSTPGTTPLVPAGVIGRLAIPHLHLTAMVREGADSGILRQAVGHIPGTALPGRKGNVGLAGHRDTFFRPLRNIQPGDAIELQTGERTYQYIVESTRIVKPQDVRVLDSSNRETLTLVTCYPFYYVGSAPKRFIVQAALAQSSRGD